MENLMNKKVFFIGASLLIGVFISWQLKFFFGSPYQQANDEQITKVVSPEAVKIQKIVTIKNNIEPAMLRYKHWSGTYKPTTFVITINGQEIKPNTQQDITITNNQLAVRFDYAFLNGKRKGAKIVSFTVNTNKPTLNLSFSWDDKWQVIIDNATPCQVKKESFNSDTSHKT